MFNSLHSNTNQELFEKCLCNQGSHHENYGRFLLCKGSHHVQPPNQYFLLSAKMNGTQRRTLGKSLKNVLHVLWCVWQKVPRAEAMSNSKKKIKSIALAVIKLCLSEGISQAVSQSVSQLEENSVI